MQRRGNMHRLVLALDLDLGFEGYEPKGWRPRFEGSRAHRTREAIGAAQKSMYSKRANCTSTD